MGINGLAFNGYGCIDETGPVHTGHIFIPPQGSFLMRYDPYTYTITLKYFDGDELKEVIQHADPDTGFTLSGPGPPCG